jgi:hypothetical protein
MAVTASGLYVLTFRDILKQALAIDLTAATHKVAMYTNSLTPDLNADTGYTVSPYTSNEVSGTGYVSGGTTLVTPTLTASSGNLTFDATDVSWPSSTITNARCALVYAAGATNRNNICLINFGGDYSTSNGTFTLQFSPSGIFIWDLTP